MTQITVKQLPDSAIEIIGEIAAERFASFRPAAIAQLNQEAKIDGFRPGHVPEEVLVSKIGEERVLYMMAELAFQTIYPEIVREQKIDAIGRPEITITKLAKDNPLGYKIVTAVSPSFGLPDHKAIAKEVNAKRDTTPVTVDEKEMEELAKQHPNEPKEKLEESLKVFKERQARDRHRLTVMEAIIAKTELTLPKVLIDAESGKMLHELQSQIENMGLKFEDYLKHLKKTEEELRAELAPDAIKRLKTSMILAAIFKAEKLSAPADEVEKETKHLQEHYKDAPYERLRAYVTDMLESEAVWKWLEEQK